MDNQSSTQNIPNPQMQNIPSSFPPDQQNGNNNAKKRLLIIFAGALVLILISTLLFFKKPQKTEEILDEKKKEVQTISPTIADVSTKSEIEIILAEIEKKYAGELPWENIQKRAAYQFYPKELKDLRLATDKIAVYYDQDYKPIKTFEVLEFSIPLKNAYLGFYAIPQENRYKYNLDEFEFPLPAKISLYEFSRELTIDELNAFRAGKAFKCNNKFAEVKKSSFSNEKIIFHSCDLNLTEDQKAKLYKDSQNFFDNAYYINFLDKNIFIEISFLRKYIDDPRSYLQDYLEKLFTDDDELFIKKNQIKSPEESKKTSEIPRKMAEEAQQ